ncbi:hypothetical protein C0989_003016 [Termitomyces sp. Mn162]|nr:hypothetical protein C0989_003016 [Termitomyces sp. Mn162]
MNEDVEATELLETYDFLMKYIIIGTVFQYLLSVRITQTKATISGEAGTGKSCLLHHFTHNSFKDYSQHTIGVEFSSRTVKLGEKRIKLQLWDTAGQERFSRDSFVNLSRWLVDARALGSPHLVAVLVGNKSDREEDREVEWAEASRWAAENGMQDIFVAPRKK